MSLNMRLLLFATLLFCLKATLCTAGDSPLPTSWTSQDAVRFALNNSPDARSSQQRILGARADLQSATAALYPKIGVSVEYTRTDTPMYSFGNILNQGVFDQRIDFNDPGVSDNLQFKTTARYRLYSGGQTQAAIEAASALEKAADFDLDALHSTLGYEVVRAFYTIIQAEETVGANISTLKAIEASLVVAQARYEEGDLLKTDLLNLEVQQARARENLIQAEHGLELARLGFLNLLGLEERAVVLDTAGSVVQQTPQAPEESNRAELRAMDARIEAAQASLTQARAGFYPTVDTFLSYQLERGLELDGSSDSWLGGLRLDYTLFDGKRTSAAVQRAHTDVQRLHEQRRKIRLAFTLEKETAVLALALAEERIQVTDKMLTLARESVALSRARFREGVILSSDLIDAENRLNDAEVRHAVAKAAQKIAVADLRRCSGLPQFD
ncbi:MAG: transporter [Desulfobulbus propionicus]|nr:MAG: transporter [Desulfobulbus propionicus]